MDEDTMTTKNWYAQNSSEVDFFLKKKECEEELVDRPKRLERQLTQLDSVLAIRQINNLPLSITKGVIKVDTDFSGDECMIFILYAPQQFFIPCEEPFNIDPKSWGKYKNLSKYIADGRICLMKVPPSQYTQVNSIPKNISITQESADELLGTIERMLGLYPQELKVSFPEYVQYEEGKSLSGLKDVILLRVKFIDYCMKKLKA